MFHIQAGFEALITVDNASLPEYQVATSEDGNTVTCWIPSEEGKRFVVKWVDLKMVRTVATIGYLYVDGHLADRPIIDCGISGERDDAISDGVPTNKDTIKPFTFSKIEVTDDDAYKGLHGSHGQVAISIWAIAVLEPLERIPTVDVSDNQKIHERIKTDTNNTHCVKFGEETRTTGSAFETLNFVKLHGAPLLTFVFRYRPEAILKATGVIPTRPASPRGARGMKRRSISPLPAIKKEDADSDIEIVEVSMNAKARSTLTVQGPNKVVSPSTKKKAAHDATSSSSSKTNGTVSSMESTMVKVKKETASESLTREVKTENTTSTVGAHRTKRTKTALLSSYNDVIDLT